MTAQLIVPPRRRGRRVQEIPLSGAPEPGGMFIVLGWHGPRAITLNLEWSSPEWIDDAVQALWEARQLLAAKRDRQVTR
jgi:hypothetical protein